MRIRVQKWGNSLALRIPKAFASEVGVGRETEVEVTLQEGRIVVSPVRSPDITLAQLLDGITPENLHDEMETGPATGREAW